MQTSSGIAEALQNLETELANEDVASRSVRISLGLCQAVEKDLIPILMHSQDSKIFATTVRILVNLTLPAECLMLADEALLAKKSKRILPQLQSMLLASKTAFLSVGSTSIVVGTLREEIIKSERHQISMSDENCNLLKNCLLLLRNILHCPDQGDAEVNGIISPGTYSEWQSAQNKLVWNLFVQGLDGALLLMINSKYKEQWTVPLVHIVTLLYKDQNIVDMQLSLNLVSSTSESSGEDEESDTSKNSSTSVSSEPSKKSVHMSDSGCFSTSDVRSSSNSSNFKSSQSHTEENMVMISSNELYSSESVEEQDNENSPGGEISMDAESNNMMDAEECGSDGKTENGMLVEYDEAEEEEANSCPNETELLESTDCSSSGVENKKCATLDKNSEKIKLMHKCMKMPHKHRPANSQLKTTESDSSFDDIQTKKFKQRNHPPVGRRGKSIGHAVVPGCSPSVCMDSALIASRATGRVKYPQWEKRNSISGLVDKQSACPSAEEIRNLLKEFTLSFLHSGFGSLILELKKTLLDQSLASIDRTHFLWFLSYFLHLATSHNLSLHHIKGILSVDILSYLTYEGVTACEVTEMSMRSVKDSVPKQLLRWLQLLGTALKEVIHTMDTYYRKSTQQDRIFFHALFSQLAELQDIRQLPLLLIHTYQPNIHTKQYLIDLVTTNHQLLMLIEKGSERCWHNKKFNIFNHLKQFASLNIVRHYGTILETFKTNSHFVNDCVMNMLHHIAGDISSPEVLLQPAILRVFSGILKEEIELSQYWEDLIMYILHKFTCQVENKRRLEITSQDQGNANDSEGTSSSGSSITSSNCKSIFSEDDDLFWWYLQFEQDKDPITRISEYIPTSKHDILQRLQIKGIVSQEKYEDLEEKMRCNKSINGNCLNFADEEEVHHITNFDDDITHLLRELVHSGHRQHITWLQDLMLETCYAKLGLNTFLTEPVPYYSSKTMQSVPMVPYNEEQEMILQNDMFLDLLKKLGLFLGDGSYYLYPRIPVFWPADMVYAIAARLGPIKKEKLKFNFDELRRANPCFDPSLGANVVCPELPPLSSCNTLSSWLAAVQKSKEYFCSVKRESDWENSTRS